MDMVVEISSKTRLSALKMHMKNSGSAYMEILDWVAPVLLPTIASARQIVHEVTWGLNEDVSATGCKKSIAERERRCRNSRLDIKKRS